MALLSAVALSLGVSGRADAQTEPRELGQPIELTRWRMRTGDSADAMRHAAWVSRPEALTSGAPAAWTELELDVSLPPDLVAAAGASGFALTLPLRGAWEARADGVAIASVGRLGDPSTDTPRALVVGRIPLEASADGRVRLALTAYRSPASLSRGGAPLRETPSLGFAPLVVARAAEAQSRAALTAAAPPSALALLTFFIAIGHLLIYRKRRELDGYLWYGLFVLSVCCWEVWVVLAVTGVVDDLRGMSGAMGLTYIASALWGEFVIRFLCRRRPGRVWSVARWIIGGLGLFTILGGTHALALTPTPLPELVWLANLFTMLALIVREVWRGNTEARTTFAGVLLASAFFAAMAFMQMQLIPSTPISVGQFGSIPLIAAMGVALMSHFTRTLSSLDETHRSAVRFVPREFLLLLGHSDLSGVRRGDAVERELNIMFADIRGFTARLEGLTPEQSFAFLNDYLRVVEPCIRAHGGYVHQYLGDGIVAMFPGSPDTPLRSAIAIQETIRASSSHGDLEVGIGIHRGRVMLGTIGGLEQLDAGVVSDAMNLTSRVEGLTKIYGTRVLLTDAVVSRLEAPSAFTLRELDRVVARGRQSPTTLFELVDTLDPEEREQRAATAEGFAGALAAYRHGDLPAARDAFHDHCARAPQDRPARHLLERVVQLSAEGLPRGWDGTFTLRR